MATSLRIRQRAKIAYGRRNRERKSRFAVDFAQQHGVKRVLLVGVSGGAGIARTPEEAALQSVANIAERGFVDAGLDVTASGLEEFSAAWGDSYVQADALNLPFEDDEFDLVYSNAVIEHVGAEEDQRRFVAEHRRVGKHWIFTTPNRWFPIESHSDVLFRHWRDEWVEQSPLVSRLLGPRDVRDLLGGGGVLHGHLWSPTLTAACE